ncbi:MAG: hypothetical protein O4805_13595 [Trichodesmium sp. St16_bin2-tuft]|nr:hypothetical protein [Trichodesmium sp. St16_bin2-tuft]MDE5124237.1 hypothetical protein [Trichodesmium sp. St19_bin1]
MTWRGSTTVQDRIFACLPYLLPLLDGLKYGRYLFDQFPPLKLIFIPLAPLLQIEREIPFFGFILFLALFLMVVRNNNISHFIRFNTMQAILLDIVLILCGLILSILGTTLGGFILETLSNMIFLGILGSFIYTVVQSAMGRYAEIPTISDAVYMQVR